ncbi:hypothetical protein GCM10027046_06660 [Uliginosibacterium flavum]|uniref:diguanylate cyclase n=1 Tax=Uliginosibacterium flavum TaxID=1396831 RepID=A0ABV2TIM2_9RHOO
MLPKQAEITLLALPAALTVGLALSFAWPTPTALFLTALAGLLPPLWRLHREQAALAALATQAQTQKKETWDFIRRIINVIPYPVYVKDARSCYVLFNTAFELDKAKSYEQLIGRDGLAPGSSEEAIRLHYLEDGEVLAGRTIYKEEHRNHAVTGQELYRVITKGTCSDPTGEPVIVGVRFYVTEQRIAQRSAQEALERETALREQVQQFVQRLIDVIPDPVYIKKTGGRYVMVNDAFAEYRHLDKSYIVSSAYPPPPAPVDVLTRQASIEEDNSVLVGGEILKEEHVIRKATGEEVFRIVCKRHSIYFDNEPVIIGIDHHITRWRVAERELQRLAQQDALTGIANRRHFREEADRAIDRAERYGEPLSLVMLDLDHFKHVNDSYGHQAGDQVLLETVSRINSCLRKSDIAGRWGGEEFVVLLPHTDAAEALFAAERLRTALAASPILADANALTITLSAGFAQRLAGETLDSFIARADTALYQAKNSGRNRVVGFPTDNPAPINANNEVSI